MGNLVDSLWDQGKLGEVASMQKEVVEKSRRILGNEHPDTIRAINNLAIATRDQGKLEEAASMRSKGREKAS